MKLIYSAIAAATFVAGTASAQEFAFFSDQRDDIVVWSLDGGEERRIDLRSILGTCGQQQSPRFIDNVQPDTSSGMLFGHSYQCGGNVLDFLSVNTLTGEVDIQSFDLSASDFSASELTRSFLTLAGASGVSAQQISAEIETSSAVASALEIQLPVDGASNRVGLTSGAFGNEQAFGVSYARVQGRFDVGLAYAQGDGGRNAGKVSVGFSW